MAEAALFLGWGRPARGREKAGVEVFNEGMQYWGRLQKEGQIESFDMAVLTPHGGLLGFSFSARNSAADRLHSPEQRVSDVGWPCEPEDRSAGNQRRLC